jgi:hypothetical protein
MHGAPGDQNLAQCMTHPEHRVREGHGQGRTEIGDRIQIDVDEVAYRASKRFTVEVGV